MLVLHPSRVVDTPYIHIIQDGHDKDVEVRVPPPHNNPWAIRLVDVRRPEHSHKPIMLYHISRWSIERWVDVLLEGSSASELLSRRYANARRPRVLLTVSFRSERVFCSGVAY